MHEKEMLIMKWDIEKVEEFPEEEQIKYCKKALNHYKLKQGMSILEMIGACGTMVSGFVAAAMTIIGMGVGLSVGGLALGLPLAIVGLNITLATISSASNLSSEAVKIHTEAKEEINKIKAKLNNLKRVRA